MERTEWYKTAVVYQIYPFSFMDADNDGWGDMEGILSKLDYLQELGITAIWFSPLYKSPDCDFGYDIADYRDIDEKFGTLEDFRRLLAACHARGIRVIMDMAINHSSAEHPWFRAALQDKNSPYRDYYIIREGRRKRGRLCPPTNWTSSFTGSAWERIPGTEEFYLHLFCREQPDLNWENPALRQEAADIFNFWLELGVDGFRLDVFNMFSKTYPLRDGKRKLYSTGEEFFVDGPRMHEFLRELNDRAFSRYDCFTVGESFRPHPEDARRYVARESRELDSIFNFGHLDSDNRIKFFPRRFDLRVFKAGLFGPQKENFGSGWNTLVLENHDVPRSISRFGIRGKKYRYEAATLLPTVTFLGFGTPFIYMGEEFGMENADIRRIEDCRDPVSHFIFSLLTGFGLPEKAALGCVRRGARDHARVPMHWNGSVNGGFNRGAVPWQPLLGDPSEVNLEKDLGSGRSVFRYYQRIIALKKNDPAAIYGKPELFDAENRRIVCFTRTCEDGNGLLVVGNFSGRPARYRLPQVLRGRIRERLLSNCAPQSAENERLFLRPYEARVYRLRSGGTEK